MFQTILLIAQKTGFCIYVGVFFTYAIRLVIPHDQEKHYEQILRSFQENGVVLGLSLGLFIYSTLLLQYLHQGHFDLPIDSMDLWALVFFLHCMDTQHLHRNLGS